MITIRPARFEDMPILIEGGRQFYEYGELDKRGLNFNENSFAMTLINFMGNPGCCLLVAEKDGSIVASIAGLLSPWLQDLQQFTAQEMWWWAFPEGRNTEAPWLLMSALEEWARKMGAKVLCMAGFANRRAKALERIYGRKGFMPLETQYIKEL